MTERELWLMVRRALLMIVAAIEKRYVIIERDRYSDKPMPSETKVA